VTAIANCADGLLSSSRSSRFFIDKTVTDAKLITIYNTIQYSTVQYKNCRAPFYETSRSAVKVGNRSEFELESDYSIL